VVVPGRVSGSLKFAVFEFLDGSEAQVTRPLFQISTCPPQPVTERLMDFLKSAVASAISKGPPFPYSFGDRVDVDSSIWSLFNGTKRVSMKLPFLFTSAAVPLREVDH
jgi:hypothetical protein